MKASELTGAALDWAVAKCENYLSNVRLNKFKQWQDLGRTQVRDDDYTYWNPSEDWAQGGPIIEREKIGVWWDGVWHAKYDGCQPDAVQDAEQPLIAAMRCFVASKMGDDIEVPPELK